MLQANAVRFLLAYFKKEAFIKNDFLINPVFVGCVGSMNRKLLSII